MGLELSEHAKQVRDNPQYDQARAAIYASQKQTKARIEKERKSQRKPGQIAELSAHAKAVRDNPKYKEAAKEIIARQQITKASIKESQKANSGKLELSAHAKEVRDNPKYKEAAQKIIQQQQAGKERVKLESQGIIKPAIQTAKSKGALSELKDYEVKADSGQTYYDVKTFLKDKGGSGISTLKNAGFDWKSLQGVSSQNLAESEQRHKLATTHITSQIWQGMTPWDEAKGQTATAAGVGIMAAELIVPGVYTARHWNEMSSAERAFSIGMDVVSLIPVAGAAARGAKGVGVASRGARLAGAAKGIGREAVAQIRGPVDLIIHPIESGKSAARSVRNLTENVVHPSKIPEAVLTTSDGAVRIRVGKDMTKSQALAARDELMRLAQEKGSRPIVEIGGQTVELTKSPFMRETGGLAHATPDIEILEGAKITATPNMPKNETGWFLSHEPAVNFTKRSAHGLGEIPVASKASGKVLDIGKYRSRELVYLDKAPIKKLNLADAVNVPEKLNEPLLKYIQKNDGTIYGSLNEWVKVKKALKPNDIDVIFRDSNKAIKDFIKIAEDHGFEARRAPHAVEIKLDGEWVQLADVASDASHVNLDKSRGLPSYTTNLVDGVKVETLGKQYIGQSYGTISKSTKAALRSKKLDKAAGDVKKIIKEAGITQKKPGIYVISPESAERAVSSNKLYKSFDDGLVAELERKMRVGDYAPKVKHKLFTRVGADNQRVAIYLEEPLSRTQIAKLKGLAIIEDIKAPFKPVIKVSKARKGVSMVSAEGVDEIADVLRASGNIDQALALNKLGRTVVSGRVAPRALNNVVGKVSARQISKARADLKKEIDRTTTKSSKRSSTPEKSKAKEPERSTSEKPRESTPERSRVERPKTPEPERPRVEKTRTPTPERSRVERPKTSEPKRHKRDDARVPRSRKPRKDTGRKRVDREDTNKKPRMLLPGSGKSGKDRFVAPEGSVTHAQGIGWWTYLPPYGQNDRKFTREKPEGATVVANARKAIETIQSMGGETKLADHYDMGIMDVMITKPPKTPSAEKGKKAIKFTRDTNKTYGKLRKQNPIEKQQKKPKVKKNRVGPYHYKNGAMSRRPFTQ